MSVANRVEAKIKRLPKGKPLPLNLFSDCGAEGAVRTALSRLVKRGELANVARGIYARPKPNEFFGTSLPAPKEVAALRCQGKQPSTPPVERGGFRSATPMFSSNTPLND